MKKWIRKVSRKDSPLGVGEGIFGEYREDHDEKLTYAATVLLISIALPLTVLAQGPPPTFSKAFSPSTIGPGSVSTLTLTIDNTSGSKVTDLAFSDTLPTGVTIATPANAATSCVNGMLTLSGNTISLSNGRVGTGETCTISVDATSSTAGTHTNLSGDLTSSAGNHGRATADLTVDGELPGLSQSFSPSTIPLGGTSTLTFTIDNTANASFVGGLNFLDNLPAGMVVASPINASSDCPSANLGIGAGEADIAFSGAVLAASSCIVSVDVTTETTGVFVYITEWFRNLDSIGVATAALNVPVGFLTKSFTDDPVPPGGTVTLEFTVTNLDRSFAATDIEFTDDLSFLTDLTATGLPLNNACNGSGTLAGSAGDTFLTFSGGTLSGPGETCTFSVTLDVPGAASTGSFTNTTVAITATIDGVGVTGNTATDVLVVDALPTLTKTFTDDPVGAGDTVDLEFTITNTSASTATDIFFVDVFDEILPTATVVPVDGVFCGDSSTATFTPLFNPPAFPFEDDVIPASLTIADAELAGGASCTFSITLDVLAGAAEGTYANTTSEITATIDSSTVAGNPASDDLLVVGAPHLNKEFTDDPVQPGGTVTLEFTIAHVENAPGDATGITFTDDLALILPGTSDITYTGLTLNDVCGGGSSISGTSTLTFAGGSLSSGTSCTFSVALDVPSDAAPPHQYDIEPGGHGFRLIESRKIE